MNGGGSLYTHPQTRFHGELQRSAAMAAAHEQQQHQSNSMGGMGGMGGRRRGLGGGLIGGLSIQDHT